MRNLSIYNLFKIGYLVFPFFSFLMVLKNYRAPWFKNALWLFVIFYGFSMSFVETIDAYVYKSTFEDSANIFRGFDSILDVFNTSKTGRIDFANSIINYSLSFFTDNYHYLFAIYGLIFGFFYSRNIDFILKQVNIQNQHLVLGLILFLSFFIGFWNINGFRFWTACHIFVYGIINYIYFKRKFKGLLFILISITFHLSFVLPASIFVLSKYLPTNFRLYIAMILFLTLYNPLSNLSAIQSTLKEYVSNEQIETKIDVYTSDETLERSESASIKTNIRKVFLNFFIVCFILGITWLLIPKFKDIRTDELSFLHYGVCLTLVSSVLNFVPSLGVRFTSVGLFVLLIGCTVLVLRYGFLLNRRKVLSKLGFCSCAIIFVINVWILFTFSLHTIFGNFLTVLIDSEEILYSVGDLTIDLFK